MDLCLCRHLFAGLILCGQRGRQHLPQPLRTARLARTDLTAHLLHRTIREDWRENAGLQGRNLQERRGTLHPHLHERCQPRTGDKHDRRHVGRNGKGRGKEPQAHPRTPQRAGRQVCGILRRQGICEGRTCGPSHLRRPAASKSAQPRGRRQGELCGTCRNGCLSTGKKQRERSGCIRGRRQHR